MSKRIISIILASCVILLSVAFSIPGASAQSATAGANALIDYGLADRCEDGNILHCFNWTLNQIKAALPDIASSGFTSVQTSPLQPHSGSYQWYWLYQPTNFTVGNEIGSYDDLKSLCTEADKYGIKVIVDVVANHLAGSNNGSWSNSIDSSLKKSEYFHNLGACEEDSRVRFNITHKNIGMPDLNSEHQDIQDKVKAMINSLKAAGVDGIRWDAAKHISLPSEECDFWEEVTVDGLYHYGEILDVPNGNSGDTKTNNALMAEYAQYIGVTDEVYSRNVLLAFRDSKLSKSNGNWLKKGLPADRLVYWGESHDTYCNNGISNGLDQNMIDRAYAILASRAESQALYLSRPFEKNHNSISYGTKGSTHFTSNEVAAVNRFHNTMIGSEEKFSTSSGCYVVCRGGGAVIVSLTDSNINVTVTNSGGMVPDGTYTDEVSGSTWTVSGNTITGRIGGSGIAVIYDKNYEAPKTMIGDADESGTISIMDATCIQRHIASLDELGKSALKAADADLDGAVAVTDATLIRRFIAGNIKTENRIGEYL